VGNTRNLGDLLNTDSTIATADVADGGITTAKLADDAITQAKIGADAVGTTELANDVVINTSSSNTTLATFTNTGGHNTSSGVVHVKQSSATNNPTMVLEQTGAGGNTGDKQGLHIKLAGQNSGDGQAIAVTTTNSNLNSGNAFDCFRVFNNGAMSLLNQANTLMDVTSDGYVKRPQLPAVFATRDSTEQIFIGNLVVVTGLDSTYFNSYPVNNKSWWDSSTSKYTAPTGSGTTYHYVSFSSLLGVTIPSSGTNYGLIGIYHSGTATANNIYRAYMDVPNEIGTAGNMKFNTLTACGVVKMVAGNFLQPYADGTNGVNKRVHSGTYTNFSAIQIG
jgi:hypothetical protein